MTNLFPTALEATLQRERGFVHDPLDPGGATNMGITIGTLSRWRGRLVSVDDVKALRRPEVDEIYLAYFWRPMSCDKLVVPPTPFLIFDAAVLFGLGVSAICAQRAAVDCGFLNLRIDGHLGPASAAALNVADPAAFAARFSAHLKARIDQVIARRPTSERFRDGWLRRVEAYSAAV